MPESNWPEIKTLCWKTGYALVHETEVEFRSGTSRVKRRLFSQFAAVCDFLFSRMQNVE